MSLRWGKLGNAPVRGKGEECKTENENGPNYWGCDVGTNNKLLYCASWRKGEGEMQRRAGREPRRARNKTQNMG